MEEIKPQSREDSKQQIEQEETEPTRLSVNTNQRTKSLIRVSINSLKSNLRASSIDKNIKLFLFNTNQFMIIPIFENDTIRDLINSAINHSVETGKQGYFQN